MVYMLLGTGFEETEAIAPLDLLRRAGVDIMTVGVNGKTVYGSHKIGIEADILLSEMDLTNLEMIVLPGGLGGVASVRASEEAMNALRFAWENGKFVAAICAGPTVLADLPDAAAVRDGRLITGTSAGCAIPFGLELIKTLKGENEAERIAQQIVIR